jgi:hypothetical protein
MAWNRGYQVGEEFITLPPHCPGELRYEVDHGEGLLVLKRCRFEEP